MSRARRMSMTVAVIVCSLSTQWTGTLFASETGETSAVVTPPSPAVVVPGPNLVSAPEPPATGIVTRPIDVNGSPAVPTVLASPGRFTFDAAALPESHSGDAGSAPARDLRLSPIGFNVSSGQVYPGPPYPYPYHHHDHDASIVALMLGSAAAITGTAVLVYANRPECSLNPFAGGCGYGTKVFGSAVLAGGIVGLFIGALTW